MSLSRLFLLFFSFLSTIFNIGNAVDCRSNSTNSKPGVSFKIIVDLNGRGNFTRVQDAIDSIPSDNTEWIGIYVNPGIYRERVKVPRDKPCIVLQGDSLETTVIAFGAHQSTNESATFISEADNFVAKQISFKNTYNHKSPNDYTQAVAAQISGDKSAFYWCGFYGFQDTLWDVSGRHFFKSCHIEGAIDFIWGSGQSLYENCNIVVIGKELGVNHGFITAQGRQSKNDPSGFVFKECNVYGNGSVELGRAYGPYSRVIFDNTMLGDIVRPEGWFAWDFSGHEKNLEYVEANCHGAGSNISGRVKWLKKLSPRDVHKYTNISFIDNEGWILKQPSL